MTKGAGYIDRWIRFGGRRGVITFHKFRDGHWLLFLGPLRMHHFGKRFRRWFLPWPSKATGSIHWLRMCFGFRGLAQ